MRRIIDRIREKVRSGQYGLTFHAIEEMAEEGFGEEDFEQAMMTGRIVRRQTDRLGRRKYTVEGLARDKDVMEVAMEGDRCDFCLDGRLRSQQVREYYRAGKGLVVIEKVPAYVCEKCGERYYEAHVAKQMPQLAKRAPRIKSRISFPLIRFQEKRALA